MWLRKPAGFKLDQLLETGMEKTYLISMKEEELEQLILRCVRQVMREQLPDLQLAQRPRLGGIELAQEITRLSKATIYGLCMRREIPHKKRGNRLYFEESELINWINGFQQKTATQIDREAEQYIQSRLERMAQRKRRSS